MEPRQLKARVLAVQEHPLPYYSLILQAPRSLEATRPGQFLMVQIGNRLEPYLRRAFSVHDVSKGEDAVRLEILIKTVGRGTQLLSESRPGDEVLLLGPLGRPFKLDVEAPVALVAGGVGSAALLLLAQHLQRQDIPFDFFYGGHSKIDLVRLDVFQDLAQRSGGRLFASTEDGSLGERGLVTAIVKRALTAATYRFLYSCGPMGLLRALAQLADDHGIDSEAALETPMGCGFGACLGCAVPHVSGRYALCCREGPVFSLAEVQW